MSSATVVVQTAEAEDAACPECSGQVRQEGPEAVCTDCGVVLEDAPIDHGQEWRAFDQEERQRVGAPNTITQHDHGLGTEIGGRASTPAEARRRTWQDRSRFRSKRERNLASGLGEISRIVSTIDQAGIKQRACRLFRMASDANLLQGRSIEAVAAAAVYAACRERPLPVSLEEIADVSPIEISRVRNAHFLLVQEFGLELPPVRPTQWVPRIAGAVSASAVIRERAVELADVDAVGRTPACVAAAAVYQAALEQTDSAYSPITQKEIADAAGCTMVSIRNNFEHLANGGDSA